MTPKILILVAVICLVVGLFFGYTNYSYMKSSERIMARVDSIEKSKKRITPTFEYTVKNKKYTLEGPSTRPDAYEIGDEQLIFYNPDNPEDAKIASFMNLWFLPVFLCGFSMVLFLVGFVLMLASKNKNPTFTIKRPGNLQNN